MQHYVASRPMFIDVELMNEDIQVVLGDKGLQSGTTNIARGLSTVYKEIAGMERII
jgi:exocyst complex component 5